MKPNVSAILELAKALTEDVEGLSSHELLAEAAEDFGSQQSLGEETDAIIQGLLGKPFVQLEQPPRSAEAMFNFATALRDDLESAPHEELLAEVAEDFGSPQALSREVDELVSGLDLRGDVRMPLTTIMDKEGMPPPTGEGLGAVWQTLLDRLFAISTGCIAAILFLMGLQRVSDVGEIAAATPRPARHRLPTKVAFAVSLLLSVGSVGLYFANDWILPPVIVATVRPDLMRTDDEEALRRQQEDQKRAAALQSQEEPKRQEASRVEVLRQQQEEQKHLAEAQQQEEQKQKRQSAARLVAARQEEQNRREAVLRQEQEEQKRQSAARDTAAIGLPGEANLARAEPPADPAIAELDRAISANPNDVAAIDRRGRLLAFQGRYSSAIKDFDDVIRLRPRYAEAFNNRCWVHAIIGDLQSALNDCNAALQLDPSYADAFDSRALVNLKSGQPGKAITDYDAALRIDPKRANSLYGRGLAKIKTDDVAGGNLDIAKAKSIQANIAEEFSPALRTPPSNSRLP
jgi:tetratricopeptide (TPR) repeat protein